MAKIATTRMELLARRSLLELAWQGYDLLERKRAALMQEMMRVVDTVMADADALQQAADNARFALARAEAVAGKEAIRSAALVTRQELPLQVESVNVMGVKVPRIEQRRISRSMLERGYSITGTSLTLDETATAFEAEIDAIIKMAESELRLKRLVSEIQLTMRRINALKHLLIPRLESERNYIQTVLDERERSDHFRLKMAKRLRERKLSKQPSRSQRAY
ncbi:MAG: V-type ATP synthase subunit D [Chloroflexota bacterium]|nr:MAG: V-type ATP synthase subunit D [Chloroflexota bacterium]